MPDPFGAFESSYNVASKGRKPLQGVLDAFDEDQALRRQMRLERVKNEPNEKDRAMTRYYNTQSDYMTQGAQSGSGGGSDPSDLSSVASGLGVTEEDLLLDPAVTRYKGRASVTNVPKLKQPMDPKTTDEVTAFRSTRQNLINNMRLMTPEVKKYMNPLDPRSGRNPFGNFALKAQSSFGDQSANDFLTFKAETDKVFQQFRKVTTGAQAALKELGWLEPDYPMPNDPPDLYMQKANEAIKRIEEGEKLLLDTYSQRGFRVGGMRGGMTANPFAPAAGRADNVGDESSANTPIDTEAIKERLRKRYFSSG